MAEPVRNPWFAALIGFQARRGMRRTFHGLFVEGAEHARAAAPGSGLIGCANHTNFWDGFVAQIVGERLCRRATYVLQEERHLARYPFLRKAGAIGIDLETPRAAVGGLRAGLGVLGRPDDMLWVFPQGRLEHPCRVIEVRPGACHLSKRSGCPILPMAFAYEWISENRPGIYVSIGPLLAPGTAEEALRESLTAALARIRGRVESRNFDGMEALIPFRKSIQRRWDRFWHAALRRPGKFEWRMP
jgi:1-acyl-sn-glycerol-3-phosphate acyltransferase